MPDISSQLDTIANDRSGANVKQAIYEALVIVNNAKTPSQEDNGFRVGPFYPAWVGPAPTATIFGQETNFEPVEEEE